LKVPEPRWGITIQIFLEKIGKGCAEYVDKFESWEELMTLPSKTLKKRGIPTKPRRWILRWRNKYKCGEEPYQIRFKNKGKKKNKLIKKAAFEKHQELMKKGYEKRKAIYLKMMEERDQRTIPEEKLENM